MIAALISVLVLLQAAPASATPQSTEGGAQRVRTRAEGVSRDDAIRQALRNALEQAAGVQIGAFSQTENFALLRDTIYTRASGVVRDFRVLSEQPTAGGGFRVEIEADVVSHAIEQEWGRLQSMLAQLGRPRVMVWIEERIDGRLQSDSIVAARIEQLLTASGLDLVDRQAVLAAQRRAAEPPIDQIARDTGADLIVRGVANANSAGNRLLHRQVRASMYVCDVQVRIYYASTGRLIASESIPATRAGVRSHVEQSDQAGRAALVQATLPDVPIPGIGPPLAIRVRDAVLAHWAEELGSTSEIVLELKGVSYAQFVTFQQMLRDQDRARIESLDGDFTAGVGTLRVRAALTAAALAELMLTPPLAERVEVTRVTGSRVEARWTAQGN